MTDLLPLAKFHELEAPQLLRHIHDRQLEFPLLSDSQWDMIRKFGCGFIIKRGLHFVPIPIPGIKSVVQGASAELCNQLLDNLSNEQPLMYINAKKIIISGATGWT